MVLQAASEANNRAGISPIKAIAKALAGHTNHWSEPPEQTLLENEKWL